MNITGYKQSAKGIAQMVRRKGITKCSDKMLNARQNCNKKIKELKARKARKKVK